MTNVSLILRAVWLHLPDLAGGLMFHQNAEHSGLEGPQEFKCALCDYTASKNDIISKHKIREHGIPYKNNEKSCVNYTTTGRPILNIWSVVCKLCVKQTTHEMYVDLDSLVWFAMACSLTDLL